ncbi:hypothetical protein AB1Y20_000688 [Prymnesium parvum]|uniref:shikimate kinase n=1 Tax=Prymnesium parvum TaxID=97485 RepID=A0AB34K8V7_PRYPA
MSDRKRSKVSPPPPPGGGEATEPRAADRTLVLIGMRGAGKTHLGTTAARALCRSFFDLDQLYEAKHEPILRTAQTLGWGVFREREVALLEEVLKQHPTGAVIATGGGVVETEAGRAVLREYWPVVQAMKNIEDVEAYLNHDKTRPSLGEAPRDVFERRAPWYYECADFDLLPAPGACTEAEFRAQDMRLLQLLQRAMGLAPPAPLPHEHSFVLTLAAPDALRNVDAVELRVDVLHSLERLEVQRQLAMLRSHCSLPIIFSVRTVACGGEFDGGDDEYVSLMEIGARAGVDWVEVDASREGAAVQEFCAELSVRGVRVVSMHFEKECPDDMSAVARALQECRLKGTASVIKYVCNSSEPGQAVLVQGGGLSAKLATPYVCVCEGAARRTSHVINTFWTPVTHPTLSGESSLCSSDQLLQHRKSIGYLAEKNFFIFGKPTQHSPSPAIHNAGFQTNGTAFRYGVGETDDPLEVLRILKLPTSGGGSVTIPLKESLMTHMDELSPSARAIGSLNTISRRADGTLVADNTDWIGIRVLISKALAARGADSYPELTALVMGGGGTARAACYALRQLGVGSMLVYNRSTDKAENLAREFGGVLCPELHSGVAQLDKLDILISCVPATAGLSPSEAELKRLQPIVLDAAYRPPQTLLLTTAATAGCPTIEGVEMLFEQGCAQCEIWTHRVAPRREIAVSLASFLKDKDFGDLPKLILHAMEAE